PGRLLARRGSRPGTGWLHSGFPGTAPRRRTPGLLPRGKPAAYPASWHARVVRRTTVRCVGGDHRVYRGTPTHRRAPMFAILAAIVFGLELLFEFVHGHLGSITFEEMTTAGFLFIALHLATGYTWRGRRR